MDDHECYVKLPWTYSPLPAAMDDNNEYYMKPPWTYSVEILWEDVLSNVNEVYHQVTRSWTPVLSEYGIVCKLIKDEFGRDLFELSSSSDTASVQRIHVERAADAFAAVAEGVRADLALAILLGDMKMKIFYMKNSPLGEATWRERHVKFMQLYKTSKTCLKVSCPFIEHYEQSIVVVATPLVCRLLGNLITNYIDENADFEQLAGKYLECYEEFKFRPDLFHPSLDPLNKVRAGDDSMEALTRKLMEGYEFKRCPHHIHPSLTPFNKVRAGGDDSVEALNRKLKLLSSDEQMDAT